LSSFYDCELLTSANLQASVRIDPVCESSGASRTAPQERLSGTASSSRTNPQTLSRLRTVDDSRIVAAIARGDISGMPKAQHAALAAQSSDSNVKDGAELQLGREGVHDVIGHQTLHPVAIHACYTSRV
jgi:L-fucose isomerase-like protein